MNEWVYKQQNAKTKDSKINIECFCNVFINYHFSCKLSFGYLSQNNSSNEKYECKCEL